MPKVLLLLFLLSNCILFSCAPVKFTKIQKPVPPPVPIVQRTLFEMYVDGLVERYIVLNWLFNDESMVRQKIVSMQMDLKDKTLTLEKVDRVLALEYDINTAIHNFNDKNIFSRSAQIASTLWNQAWGNTSHKGQKYKDVIDQGVTSNMISDNAVATLNSIRENGMKIEKLDLFKYCLTKPLEQVEQ